MQIINLTFMKIIYRINFVLHFKLVTIVELFHKCVRVCVLLLTVYFMASEDPYDKLR